MDIRRTRPPPATCNELHSRGRAVARSRSLVRASGAPSCLQPGSAFSCPLGMRSAAGMSTCDVHVALEAFTTRLIDSSCHILDACSPVSTYAHRTREACTRRYRPRQRTGSGGPGQGPRGREKRAGCRVRRAANNIEQATTMNQLKNERNGSARNRASPAAAGTALRASVRVGNNLADLQRQTSRNPQSYCNVY